MSLPEKPDQKSIGIFVIVAVGEELLEILFSFLEEVLAGVVERSDVVSPDILVETVGFGEAALYWGGDVVRSQGQFEHIFVFLLLEQ